MELLVDIAALAVRALFIGGFAYAVVATIIELAKAK